MLRTVLHLNIAGRKNGKNLKICSVQFILTALIYRRGFILEKRSVNTIFYCFLAVLSLFTIGLFSFCTQTASDCTSIDCCFEPSGNESSFYLEEAVEVDFAALRGNFRKNNFSRSKNCHSSTRLAKCQPDDNSVYLNFLSNSDKKTAINSELNLICELIACSAPPRASPFFLQYI